MLAPPVVRAGVPRPQSRGSASTPMQSTHRRSYTSTGSGTHNHRLRPANLPPLLRASLSGDALPHPLAADSPALAQHDLPNTPSRQDHDSRLSFINQVSPSPFRSSLSSTVYPEPPNPSRDSTSDPRSQPSHASSSPTSASPGTAPTSPGPSKPFAKASEVRLRMSPMTLVFHVPYYERQFHAYLEQQRATSSLHHLLISTLLATLALTAVALDAVSISDEHYSTEAAIRLALVLPGLLILAVMTAVRPLLRGKLLGHRVQCGLMLLAIAMMALLTLGWTLYSEELGYTSNSSAFMLYLQIFMIGRRPLLFPYAVLACTTSTVLFTALMLSMPTSSEVPAGQVYQCIALYVNLLWVVCMLRLLERAQRVAYVDELKVALLRKEKDSLDNDTKALKGEFFQLTLERFDIADVEEEGKALTSAMEQAMGKLQALGKKQDLPAYVLQDIMKVISLLGSGSDLFKPKMEGGEWKNGLYGGDDELTRYIYETLNGDVVGEAGGVGVLIGGSPTSPLLSTVRLSTDSVHPLDEATGRPHAYSLSAVADLEGRAVSPALAGTSLPPQPTAAYDRHLSSLLHQLDDWDLDIFEVATLTGGKPLFFIGMALLKKYGYIDTFGLDKVQVGNFLRELEGGYNKGNPYHNSRPRGGRGALRALVRAAAAA